MTDRIFDFRVVCNSSSFNSCSRFINARRRIVQPMIDASSRTGKSPVVTVFKSRKRKISNSDIQHHEPQYQAFPGSYQRATSYQPEYHYPTVPSAYYADTNFTPSHFAAQSQPSCQFAVSVDTSPVALSLPNCMETRPHAMQTPYGHWTANGHPYPAYTSESQNQMYVKASWVCAVNTMYVRVCHGCAHRCHMRYL